MLRDVERGVKTHANHQTIPTWAVQQSMWQMRKRRNLTSNRYWSNCTHNFTHSAPPLTGWKYLPVAPNPNLRWRQVLRHTSKEAVSIIHLMPFRLLYIYGIDKRCFQIFLQLWNLDIQKCSSERFQYWGTAFFYPHEFRQVVENLGL